MATYRVAFEGKWQGTFDERDDALDWAKEVGETGRLVYVEKRRWWFPPRLVATFPRERAHQAKAFWSHRGGHGGF
jgi:hypothetical protein